jgi:hypothetical protein
MEVMIVVIKRIASILVASVVAMSMTGCNIGVDDTELLERKVQQLEQQIEDMEQAKDVVEEQLEQEVQSKEEQPTKAAEPKQQSENNKSNDESTRKPRYNGAGVYIGDFTDSEVEQLNKAIDKTLDHMTDEINKEIEKELQQMEQDDYWETDGDLPNPEPQYKSNEETNTYEEPTVGEPTNSPEVAEQYMRENNLEEVNY